MEFLGCDTMDLVFAFVGGLVGWFLRSRQNRLPPEVDELVQILQKRRQQKQAETMLKELTDPASEEKVTR